MLYKRGETEMKRVLSIMLALMLAFTMVSGITALASDEYDVVTTLVNEDYSTTMTKYTATRANTMASTQLMTLLTFSFFEFFHHVQGIFLVM